MVEMILPLQRLECHSEAQPRNLVFVQLERRDLRFTQHDVRNYGYRNAALISAFPQRRGRIRIFAGVNQIELDSLHAQGLANFFG